MIMMEHQQYNKGSGCQVSSKFSNCTYDFTWSIENYSKLNSSIRLTSPVFHPIKNQTFYATLEADGLTFFLQSEGNMIIKHNFSITDSSGKETFYKIDKETTYSKPARTNYSFLFAYVDVKRYCDSTNDRILIFKCAMEIDYFCKATLEQDPSDFQLSELVDNLKTMYPSSDNQSILVENLKSMYTSSLHADINLQVEDEVVHVHKSLLCARSPVFAKMFESPMEENEKNAIAIPDIELPVLKDLLEFLYTGNLRAEDFESVYALYYAADKYDVSSLRKTCIVVLVSKMSIENACRVLSLANQHSDVPFKESAMAFVQAHFDEIVGTDSWDEFLEEETKLAADVMRCRSKKAVRK